MDIQYPKRLSQRTEDATESINQQNGRTYKLQLSSCRGGGVPVSTYVTSRMGYLGNKIKQDDNLIGFFISIDYPSAIQLIIIN